MGLPKAVSQNGHAPRNAAGELAIVLKEFGAPPYFFSTASSSSFAFPFAIPGSMAFILCVLPI